MQAKPINDPSNILNCVLCDDEVSESMSHNARPVKDGRCCNLCNMEVVIPARFGIKVIQIKTDEKNN